VLPVTVSTHSTGAPQPPGNQTHASSGWGEAPVDLDGAELAAAEGAWVLATAADASMLVPPWAADLLLPLPLVGSSDTPMVGTAVGVSALGAIATAYLGWDSPLPETATLAPPNGAGPMGVQLRFGQVVRGVLVAVSLWELAAAALPGVGGLGIFTAAGVGIGRRQAKAGFALQTAGIARFAAGGPVGVVRSGSVVAVRARTLRVVRPRAQRAGCRLDKVA
jgi:hypothetical protein